MKAKSIFFWVLAGAFLATNYLTLIDLSAMTKEALLLTLFANRMPRLVFLMLFARMNHPTRDIILTYALLVFADVITTIIKGYDGTGSMIPEILSTARWTVLVTYNFIVALMIILGLMLRRHRSLLYEVRSGRKLLHDVVNALPIGVGVHDNVNEILLINQAGYNMLQLENPAPYNPQENYTSLLQKHTAWHDLIHVLWQDAEAHYQAGGGDLLERNLPTCNGKQLYHIAYGLLEINDTNTVIAPCARTKDQTALLVMVQDVTERENLIKSLTKAKEAAEKNSQAKSHFLANVSHELRTPITSILGFSQLATVHDNIQANNDLSDMLNTINRNSRGLLHLVDDLLDLSKAEANRLTLVESKADPRLLIYDEVDSLRPQLHEKNLAMELLISHDVPAMLCFDDGKVRQVIRNLLSNAIKFTEQGGITLRCWSSDILEWSNDRVPALENLSTQHKTRTREQKPRTNTRVTLHIEVADTGAGIAPEELANLFEPFMQTRSGLDSKQGTGLGLAISKKFVVFLGGDMIIDSQVDKGTRCHFWFTAQRVSSS